MTPDMRWRTDREYLCTDVTDGWCSFVGREREYELGRGWMDHVHENDRERLSAEIAQHWIKRESFIVTYELRRHDGEYILMRAHGTPWIDASGEFHGYWGAVVPETTIAEDVHERARILTFPQRRPAENETSLPLAESQ